MACQTKTTDSSLWPSTVSCTSMRHGWSLPAVEVSSPTLCTPPTAPPMMSSTSTSLTTLTNHPDSSTTSSLWQTVDLSLSFRHFIIIQIGDELLLMGSAYSIAFICAMYMVTGRRDSCRLLIGWALGLVLHWCTRHAVDCHGSGSQTTRLARQVRLHWAGRKSSDSSNYSHDGSPLSDKQSFQKPEDLERRKSSEGRLWTERRLSALRSWHGRSHQRSVDDNQNTLLIKHKAYHVAKKLFLHSLNNWATVCNFIVIFCHHILRSNSSP